MDLEPLNRLRYINVNPIDNSLEHKNNSTHFDSKLSFVEDYDWRERHLLGKKEKWTHNRSDLNILYRSLYISLVTTILIFIAFSILSFFHWQISKQLFWIRFSPERFSILNIILLFSATTGTIYWNLRVKFGSQWTYCADLYNKIFIEQLNSNENHEILDYKKLTLAIDILSLDLWRNKSYWKLFNYSLDRAIEIYCESSENDFLIKRIKTGSVSVKEIKKILSHAQNYFECKIYETNLEQIKFNL